MANINPIRELIVQWTEELDDLKTKLHGMGHKAESVEYNILASEALRLSMCITDLTELLVTSDD